LKKVFFGLVLISCLAARELTVAELNKSLSLALRKMPALENKDCSVNALISDSQLQSIGLPTKNYTIDFILPAANQISSPAYYKMIVYQPYKDPTAYKIKFKVRIFDQVYYALRNLEAKEELNKNDLLIKKTNLLELSSQPLPIEYNTDNKILLCKIKAGAPLLLWMISTKPLVNPGDTITVTMLYDTVSMKAPAKALQQGVIGDKIRVQLLKTKKIFTAEIQEPGKYIINL